MIDVEMIDVFGKFEEKTNTTELKTTWRSKKSSEWNHQET